MEKAILSLENLSKYYINGQNVVAGLNQVNLSLRRGEFVAITGESGSGKSTLAHILSGVLPYEDGELYLDGKPTSHYDSSDWANYRRDKVAFISQSYGILPGSTVLDNVVSALRLGGMDKDQAVHRSREILEVVELWELRRRRGAKLSSGQKQRLAIARALAKPCPILIADEPTGNLDPENSSKVIRLLAQAARERLVILITHEFSEAQDFVTRHISLHNGQVISDAQLREAPEPQPMPSKPAVKQRLGWYTARLQLRARPVWCAMVLLFFTLTAFAVFSFLGTYIVALDDTSTRIYHTDAFLDGSRDRIVAVRKDGKPMTEEDYETIVSLENVEYLERYGYISDVCYSYRQDTDYTIHYSSQNYGTNADPQYITVESAELWYTGQFVRTVPHGISDFLTEGRLPESCYEVVAGDAALLGQEITVYLKDFRNWASNAYIKLDVSVVGVTDAGTGLYFSDEVGAMLTLDNLNSARTMLPLFDMVESELAYVDYRTAAAKILADANHSFCRPFYSEAVPTENSVPREISSSEALISYESYTNILEMFFYWDPGVAVTYDAVYDSYWGTYTGEEYLNTVGFHDSTLNDLIYVSPERFSSWVSENLTGCGDQVSITIRDYAYTDRVIAELEKAGYYALSPYILGSTEVDQELAAQRLQTLYVCLIALAAVIALQIILLRALFAMEFESYRTLSNIGLSVRDAMISLMLQVLVFAAAGQLLGLAGILLCTEMGVERIVSLTRYLTAGYWVVLALVHLLSALAAGGNVVRSMRKRIYPMTAQAADLVLDDEEAEV